MWRRADRKGYYADPGWIGVSGVLIVTGYRNVIAVFRRDRRAGKIMLAYFNVAVVYGFTEAAFRMMCPLWIAFLLAIVTVPKRPERKAWTSAFKISVAQSQPQFPAETAHAYEGSH